MHALACAGGREPPHEKYGHRRDGGKARLYLVTESDLVVVSCEALRRRRDGALEVGSEHAINNEASAQKDLEI